MKILDYDSSRSKGSLRGNFKLLLKSGLQINNMSHLKNDTSETVKFPAKGVPDSKSKTGYTYVPHIEIPENSRQSAFMAQVLKALSEHLGVEQIEPENISF